MRRFAYFDLDGTLLPWDTQLLFANHVLRRHRHRLAYLALFVPLLPFAAVRLIRARTLKRAFASFLCGASSSQVQAWAGDFAALVDSLVWPALRDEIAARRKEGCTLVLNTASPSFYAEPVARRLGFDHCVATDLVLRDPMPLIPEIRGPNNKRAAKVDALRRRDLLPESLPGPGCWAYTDSPVDLPLLGCAEHKVVVAPLGPLATEAAEKGWRILTPSPAVSRIDFLKAIPAQMTGCWEPKRLTAARTPGE